MVLLKAVKIRTILTKKTVSAKDALISVKPQTSVTEE